uniref:Putative pentatricopeptide repeat-containing protein At3g49142 n=1 Tax=Anthurium amnicola TaxID=1678845 RepID=A0A1D1ZFI6_9ARAE
MSWVLTLLDSTCIFAEEKRKNFETSSGFWVGRTRLSQRVGVYTRATQNLMRTRFICYTAHLCCCNNPPDPPVRLPSGLKPAFGKVTAEFLGKLLDGCGSPPLLPVLRRLHSHLITRGFLCPNPFLGIKLMRAYSACGDPAATRQVFDASSDRNIIFFNVMIRSYVRHGRHRDALGVYCKMAAYGVRPDHYTYPCLLNACSAVEHLLGGLQIHGAVTKIGLDTNVFVGNTLITMYSRCGCLSEADRFFEGMPHRDAVSWNSVVAGYAQKGESDRALEVCKEMVMFGRVRPDAATLASILPAMAKMTSDDAFFVRRMFDEMPRKELISWNAMIAIYANNSMAADAVKLYRQMETENVEPDVVTFVSVLPACGDLSALVLGSRIHEFIKKKKMCPNMFLENALVDMYAKCGSLQAARKVFDSMSERDVVSWTSMISAYGMHGLGEDAVILFESMQNSGLKPDHIAFVSVLSACSHAGLLKEGKYYFSCMMDQCQLIPTVEHFTCIVDLLGRAGLLEEAYDFVKKMPLEPDERVWGALLSACRVHSNMTIGLAAADHLFKLVPEQSGYYVLLSNIYAKCGRWEDVTAVRSIMSSRGIDKTPGFSNVEFNDKVYTFLMGDRSHPQSSEIYAKLDMLVARIKEAGYVAEIDSALHDVEEEDKECHLAVHSEKLAIAFALINTAPGTPIRITKNLRICADCHYASKLISKITGRKIVLRDIYRFHHFEDGVCSCGDYW